MHQSKRLITVAGLGAVAVVWTVALVLLFSPKTADSPVPTLAEFADTAERPAPLAAAFSPNRLSTPIFEPDTTHPVKPSHEVQAPRDPVPNQLIIHFEPNTSAEERANYIQQIGGTVSQNIPALDTVVVKLSNPVATPPEPLVNVVINSEPDYYVSAQAEINDARYAEQWALPVIGAPSAWDALPANAPQITIAVIDSGVCLNHPDLTGRIIVGWDFVQSDAVPQDDFGHGCSVAGIIAANSNNGIGIAGAAPNAMIMPLRVLDGSGLGRYSDVAAAIVYAVDNGAQIINLSLGGYTSSSVMQNAVNYAISHGVTVIAAAGNTGTQTVLYPAAYSSVISVGSINANLQTSSFSSYGPNVDTWAPGQAVLTTGADGGYRSVNGTSFAAPYVAGIAALEMASGRQLVVDGGIAHTNPPTIAAVPTDTPESPTATASATQTQAAGVEIPELFLETDVQGAQDSSDQFGVLRTRFVDVNFNALPADSSPQAQAQSSPRISLGLFSDAQFTAVSDEISSRLVASEGLIWTGHLEGQEFSEVVLVVGDNQIEGHVTILGKLYQITYAGNGVHSINEIDPNAFSLALRDDGVPVPPDSAAPQTIAQEVSSSADDGTVIDVLVVYTASARAAAGDNPGEDSEIVSMIEASVVATNKSYANSGVTQRLRLRHTAEVVYTENVGSDLFPELQKVSNPTINGVSGVFALRNQYAADLVVFIVNIDTNLSGVCGLGWLPPLGAMQVGDTSNVGFSAMAFSCLPGGITFAHELGHNMGSNHDPANSSGSQAYSYSFGYRDPGKAFRDIMSYDCSGNCPVINFWSNQTMTFGGRAMGNASADNRTSLNNTAPKIAKYRDSEAAIVNTPVPTLTLTPVPPSNAQPTTTPTPTLTPTCNFSPTDVTQLISAINFANLSLATLDYICLTAGATYTLTAVNNNVYGDGPNGLPAIISPITIRGNGATITRGGGNALRHFYVDIGGNLILQSLSLTNGYVDKSFYMGGSILNYGGKLTVTDVSFNNNKSDGFGGAVSTVFSYGTLSTVINSSIFTNNRSPRGGAIYNYASLLSVNRSRIFGNISMVGGALMNDGQIGFSSTVNIRDSHITENSSDGMIWQEEASAIYTNAPAGSTTNIINSAVYKNGNYGVYVATGAAGVITDCVYWGHPNGPTQNGFIAGDMISAGVSFTPFQSSLNGSCRPPNDDFNKATLISSLPFVDFQNTEAATDESGELEPSCGAAPSKSVWYKYTPSATGIVRLRTANSDYDTVLSVWTGTVLGTLNEVDCNDDLGLLETSQLEFSLNAGTTYYIKVSAVGGATGGLSLYISHPISVNYTVNTSGDAVDANIGNGVCQTSVAGQCTLRAAIQEANAVAGTQTIGFDLPGTGPYVIEPESPLPHITDTVVINGKTQFGYINTPIVELSGTSTGSDAIGLSLAPGAEGSIVRSLVINLFDASAIGITADDITIEGNYIGTDVTGMVARPNNGNGIVVSSSNNLIGGTTPGSGNLISGNTNSTGLVVGGINNVVQGNIIGLNATGTAALPNDNGIGLDGPMSILGGTTPAERNIISGNLTYGVILAIIDAGGSGNTVSGNYIGTDITGMFAVPNGDDGILLSDAQNNTIGGTTGLTPGGACTGSCNLISGNGDFGISFENGSFANTILGNFIGLDVTGTDFLPNNGHGISVTTPGNTIGGATIAERNVISGNMLHGIFIGNTNGTVVRNNFIGTDTTGDWDIGNDHYGIYISGTSSNTVIGPNNVISGNYDTGVRFNGATGTGNVVRGNLIGTNADGTFAVPNGCACSPGDGIHLGENSSNITIGGMTPADRNVISGNYSDGIQIGSTGAGAANTNNVIQGNYIGTDITGVLGIPNGGHGVFIDQTLNNAVSNTVGGDAAGAGNTIAYNFGDGVYVSADNGQKISGNNMFANAGLGIDLGANGLTANDAADSDSGANMLQNFPLFTGAALYAGSTEVSGTLTSTPNTTFRIEVFASLTCDTSGYGEGELYLGGGDVTTAANGTIAFTLNVGIVAPSGYFITMTATDPNGNTSEFSKCPIAGPSNLNALQVSQVQINLTWLDTATVETAYILERSADGLTGWTQIASLPANTTTYQNVGLFCEDTYSYRVKAFRSTTGEYSAYSNIDTDTTPACAPNNDFANAKDVNLVGLPYSDTEVNLGSSPETGELAPTCSTNALSSVWYTYTPGSDETLWIDTSGSNFDTVLSVWTGASVDNLTELACDNNSGANKTSFLAVEVTTVDAPYYIMVTGDKGTGGTLNLNIREAIQPTQTPNPTFTPLPTIVPDDTTSRLGLFRDSAWLMRNTLDSGLPDFKFRFGIKETGWMPLVGDWDGDLNQVDTIGVYKNGQFWLRDTNTAGFADNRFNFGPQETGWQPIAGDWNGDGMDTIGLYKNGQFGMRNINNGGAAHYNFVFGPKEIGWIPVAGDWNSDGIDSIGVYKNGEWRLRNSNSAGIPDTVVKFGETGWLPVVGDWDRNGTETIGVYKNGEWRLRNSNTAGLPDMIIKFGTSETGWLPVSGRWDAAAPLGVMLEEELPTAAPTETATATYETIETLAPTQTPLAVETETPTATYTLEAPTITPTETPTLTITPSPLPTDVPPPDVTEPAASP